MIEVVELNVVKLRELSKLRAVWREAAEKGILI